MTLIAKSEHHHYLIINGLFLCLMPENLLVNWGPLGHKRVNLIIVMYNVTVHHNLPKECIHCTSYFIKISVLTEGSWVEATLWPHSFCPPPPPKALLVYKQKHTIMQIYHLDSFSKRCCVKARMKSSLSQCKLKDNYLTIIIC